MSTKKQRKKIFEAVKSGTNILQACEAVGIKRGEGRINKVKGEIASEYGDSWEKALAANSASAFPAIGNRIDRCTTKDQLDAIINQLNLNIAKAKDKKATL